MGLRVGVDELRIVEIAPHPNVIEAHWNDLVDQLVGNRIALLDRSAPREKQCNQTAEDNVKTPLDRAQQSEHQCNLHQAAAQSEN